MKGIGMNKFTGICAAATIVAATALQGCVVPLHTQDFAAGEVDLQGKQIYLMPTPGDGAYQRMVQDITALGNDPTGDTVADVSGGSFTLTLDDAHAVAFYGALFTDLVLGANGTIGFGEAGDNTSLTTHFMHKEVSLLPVEVAPAGSVTYDVVDNGTDPSSIAVTYAGVTAGGATATAQAEFFVNAAAFGDIALSYTVLSADAAGVYGLSNGQLVGADEATITQFLADFAMQAPLTTEIMTGT